MRWSQISNRTSISRLTVFWSADVECDDRVQICEGDFMLIARRAR